MGLGETQTTYVDPVFIGSIETAIESPQELSLAIESNELSLILE